MLSVEEKRIKAAVYARAWRAAHPGRADIVNRKWREGNPDLFKWYLREAHYKRKYGITLEERDALVAETGGKCKICGGEFKDSSDTHIDHCHSLGHIRGVLCGSCNRKLGWYEKNRDNIDTYLVKK